MNVLDAKFSELRGLCAWGVSPGHGGFLTLEFGEHSQVQGAARGQWHLWIYCCDWSLFVEGKELCNSEDENGPDQAAQVLDDLRFLKFSAFIEEGKCVFDFSEAVSLVTSPYDESEQWMLYLPDGDVLSFRADGKYSLGPGDSSYDRWVEVV